MRLTRSYPAGRGAPRFPRSPHGFRFLRGNAGRANDHCTRRHAPTLTAHDDDQGTTPNPSSMSVDKLSYTVLASITSTGGSPRQTMSTGLRTLLLSRTKRIFITAHAHASSVPRAPRLRCHHNRLLTIVYRLTSIKLEPVDFLLLDPDVGAASDPAPDATPSPVFVCSS